MSAPATPQGEASPRASPPADPVTAILAQMLAMQQEITRLKELPSTVVPALAAPAPVKLGDAYTSALKDCPIFTGTSRQELVVFLYCLDTVMGQNPATFPNDRAKIATAQAKLEKEKLFPKWIEIVTGTEGGLGGVKWATFVGFCELQVLDDTDKVLVENSKFYRMRQKDGQNIGEFAQELRSAISVVPEGTIAPGQRENRLLEQLTNVMSLALRTAYHFEKGAGGTGEPPVKTSFNSLVTFLQLLEKRQEAQVKEVQRQEVRAKKSKRHPEDAGEEWKSGRPPKKLFKPYLGSKDSSAGATPTSPRPTTVSTPKEAQQGQRSAPYTKPFENQRVTCFGCGVYGHRQVDCPKGPAVFVANPPPSSGKA